MLSKLYQPTCSDQTEPGVFGSFFPLKLEALLLLTHIMGLGEGERCLAPRGDLGAASILISSTQALGYFNSACLLC